MRTPSELEPPTTMIPKAIHSLGRKVERLYRMHDAFQHLPELIGSSFAKHMKPVGIQQGRLFLYVPNDTWRNEAWMFRTEIMQRINARMGEHAVKEVIFTRNRPAARRENDAGELNRTRAGKRLQQIDLTEEELVALRKRCGKLQNKELRDQLLRLSIRQRQLEKSRTAAQWRPCHGCGVPCEPEREYCPACARKERSRTRQKVRKLLLEVPWLRSGELAQYVPACTPQMVNNVRADLVQQLASRVTLDQRDGADAKMLVMLYLCIPPTQLDDAAIARTLYRLRHDLAKPETFRPVKRYDVIPLGRKGIARRRPNVSAHRK